MIMISKTENQVTLFLRTAEHCHDPLIMQSAKQSVFLRIQVPASSQTKGLERGCKRLARLARKTLTARFTDFFTDFEKKNPTVLQSTD